MAKIEKPVRKKLKNISSSVRKDNKEMVEKKIMPKQQAKSNVKMSKKIMKEKVKTGSVAHNGKRMGSNNYQ
jgi:hypothetical protein